MYNYELPRYYLINVAQCDKEKYNAHHEALDKTQMRNQTTLSKLEHHLREFSNFMDERARSTNWTEAEYIDMLRHVLKSIMMYINQSERAMTYITDYLDTLEDIDALETTVELLWNPLGYLRIDNAYRSYLTFLHDLLDYTESYQ